MGPDPEKIPDPDSTQLLRNFRDQKVILTNFTRTLKKTKKQKCSITSRQAGPMLLRLIEEALHVFLWQAV